MPPLELPSEIAVTDDGNDRVTFLLPHRQLGAVRFVGLPFLAAAALFLYWVVRIGFGNVRNLNRPVAIEDYFMTGLGGVLGCFAYFPIWLGLSILAGRRQVTLHGGKLRTTEWVGWLWRTKRWPLAKLDRVEIVGFFPAPAEGPKPGTLLSRLDAMSGMLSDGTRFIIAPGYPRRLLQPVAAEIARRCNAKFDAARPKVAVSTLVRADPLAKWNRDNRERPSDSRAVLDEYPEGVTITLPPAGFRTGGGIMLGVGLFMAAFMSTLIALARPVPGFIQGLFAVIGTVGVLLAVHGVRVARRRAVIAVVGTKLLILQTGLVRSKERKWKAGDLEAVRVGKSGIEINEEPVLELQIVPRAGLPFGLLAGRDVAEIAWIAAELRRRLGITKPSK
jgi:hypothetical protein